MPQLHVEAQMIMAQDDHAVFVTTSVFCRRITRNTVAAIFS